MKAAEHIPLTGAELEVEQERLIAFATNRIYDAMDTAGLTKSELARRIGKSKSYVTQLLDGERNLTLRTLALLGVACGVRWDLRPHDAAVTWVFEYPKGHQASPLPEVGTASAMCGDGPCFPMAA